MEHPAPLARTRVGQRRCGRAIGKIAFLFLIELIGALADRRPGWCV
jgi:hypothetical protein